MDKKQIVKHVKNGAYTLLLCCPATTVPTLLVAFGIGFARGVKQGLDKLKREEETLKNAGEPVI